MQELLAQQAAIRQEIRKIMYQIACDQKEGIDTSELENELQQKTHQLKQCTLRIKLLEKYNQEHLERGKSR